jgi:uncharacterized protein (TIGR02594 family)
MVIDHPLFAEECVREGIIFHVNPHYLVGVAEFRSGISDGTDGDRIGPFRLRQAEWDANSDSDEFNVHVKPEQIGSVTRQCAVFALMAHRAFDSFISAKGRNPTAKELYMLQWPDTPTKTFDMGFQKALDDTAVLIGPAADAALDDPKSVPPLIKSINQPVTRPVPPLDPADPNEPPNWYKLALKELGVHEEGDNSGPKLAEYRRLAQCGGDHDPWCAIFANAMLASCNPVVPGTRSASSQSFRDNPNFTKLPGPALGAIVVFWRNSPESGLGHVGFYRGETADSVYVLGGNEGDMVQIEPLSKRQLRGYWWPASLPPPPVGAIKLPPGTPKHQTKVT